MRRSTRDRRQSERGALATAAATYEATARPAARSDSKPVAKPVDETVAKPVAKIAAKSVGKHAAKHAAFGAAGSPNKPRKLTLHNTPMHGHRSDASGTNDGPCPKRTSLVDQLIFGKLLIEFARQARVYNTKAKARKSAEIAPKSVVSKRNRIRIVAPKSEHVLPMRYENSSESEFESAGEDTPEPDYDSVLVKNANGVPCLHYAAAGLDMLSAAGRVVSPGLSGSGNGAPSVECSCAGLDMLYAATQNLESSNNTGTDSQVVGEEHESEDEECQCKDELSNRNISENDIADHGQDAGNKDKCQSCAFSVHFCPMVVEAARAGKIQWEKKGDKVPFVKCQDCHWPRIRCDRRSLEVARQNMFALRRSSGHMTNQKCSGIIDSIDLAEKYVCLRKDAKREAKDAYWQRQTELEDAQLLINLSTEKSSKEPPLPRWTTSGRDRRLVKIRIRLSSK